MLIVDAHLDLAYNVVRGRDPTQPAADQPAVENEIATVGLPDLRAGNVRLICATIFCIPASYRPHGYQSGEEARTQALSQLDWYRNLESRGLLRLVRSPQQLDDLPADLTSAILLLEGADAVRSPDDVQEWFDAGLRVVGLAWRATRSAGGTGQPGPLTDEGRAMVKAFDQFGIIHDTSHLAEQSFWDLLEVSSGPIIASHSNCRSIVPSDRQLSDEMIRAIISRGGVIGINYYDKFLLPPDQIGKRRATLDDVVAHINHICDLAGNANHVAIGTDMDGGLGKEQIPQEVATSADLQKLAEALTKHGFHDSNIPKILGENWRTYFKQHLAHQR